MALTRAEAIELEKNKSPDDINKAIAATGKAESKVILYREDLERLNSYNYLTEMPVSMFNQSQIQARYGGGRYRAIFFNAQDEEVRKTDFGIEAIKVIERQDESTTLDRILRALENNRERGREPQSADNTTQSVLLPIILALLQRDPMKDTVAMLQVLNNGKGGKEFDFMAMMEQLAAERKAGMELGKTIGELQAGGSGDKSFWQEAITTFGPAVGAIANRIGGGTPAQGVPIVSDSTVQGSPPVVAEHLMWLVPLRQYLPFLVAKAKAKKSPVAYAQFLLEEMTDEQKEKLKVSASDPEFANQMIAAIPDFQSSDVQLWAREFIEELKAHFYEDDNTDESPEKLAKLAELRKKKNAVTEPYLNTPL